MWRTDHSIPSKYPYGTRQIRDDQQLTIYVAQASERFIKTREAVYVAVENVPTVIENANKLASIYTAQDEFDTLITSLYVAILDLLNEILRWHMEHGAEKIYKAVMQGDNYAHKINEKKAKLESLKMDIDKRAAIYQHARVGEIGTSLSACGYHVIK